MLRLALHGLRGRKGPFAGAFVALVTAAALVMVCGSLLQAGLRSDPPVERYHGAPIVLAGQQNAVIHPGTDGEDTVPLMERARLGASLVARAAAVPGVRAAIGDVSVPAVLHARGGIVSAPGDHPVAAHPWPSAALTPYRLSAGHAPRRDDELVVDAVLAARGGLHVGDRVRLASTGPARTMTVAGVETKPMPKPKTIMTATQ